MKQAVEKSELIAKLQKEILSLQGFRTASDDKRLQFGLGPLENAFPNHVFPTGAVHEFISPGTAEAAATTGFLAGMLGTLMQDKKSCVWISTHRTIFPPGLKVFGIEPDRIIFIDLNKEKDLLWTVEEALKCEALAAVVAEVKEISLTESRRLQLAVERSRVTGFLHRCNPNKIENIACVSRWQIRPISSELEPGMPGVGHPRWDVQLLKVRNGTAGSWQLQWADGRFEHIPVLSKILPSAYIKKTG